MLTSDFETDDDLVAVTRSPQASEVVADGRLSVSAAVGAFFRGTLPLVLPGYEERPTQVSMAELVAAGLTEGRHVICEAGTGTGKSLAYLVPAILWAVAKGEKVVVSTATIALQDQLLKKDIPFLARCLGKKFSAVVAKGRGNYLCLRRLHDELERFTHSSEARRIAQWSLTTETGDRAELDWAPSEWEFVSVDETCNGPRCSYFNRCFYFRARQRLEDATVIVCNHSLFALDLRLRHDSGDTASILPDFGAVVIDEAHEFEQMAMRALGIEVSRGRWPWVESRIRTLETYAVLDAAGKAEVDARITEVDGHWHNFFEGLARRLNASSNHRLISGMVDWTSLRGALEGLERFLRLPEVTSEAEEKHNLVAGMVRAVADDLAIILDEPREGWVSWLEAAGPNSGTSGAGRLTLRTTPVELGDILAEGVFNGKKPVVLTSATLAVGGGFRFLRSRLGIREALEVMFPAPFDFANQCGLYIPAHLPEPNDSAYPDAAVAEMERILNLSGGRAFLLFTSYRFMEIAHAALVPRLRWTVLKQGEAPRDRLIERFRTDTTSVLFATMSFWTGIDVPGEALSCVVMDRIPFTVPDDPVSKARAEAVEARGGSAFYDLTVPEAVVRLKQGFGRLIRSRSDRGLVAILDTRLCNRSYGATFLRSLPPAPLYRRLEDIPAELFAS